MQASLARSERSNFQIAMPLGRRLAIEVTMMALLCRACGLHFDRQDAPS